jgi:hypothetical protein
LHVVHRFDVARVCCQPPQLLGVRVRDVGMHPPQVAPWVAHAAHAVAEGQLRRLRDGPRPRSQPRRVGGIAIGEWSRRTPQVYVVVPAVDLV